LGGKKHTVRSRKKMYNLESQKTKPTGPKKKGGPWGKGTDEGNPLEPEMFHRGKVERRKWARDR